MHKVYATPTHSHYTRKISAGKPYLVRRRGSKVVALALSVMTCKGKIFVCVRAVRLELASKQPGTYPRTLIE
jgi:hypothetical protein